MRQQIDIWLNRVSMYRLTTLALAFIAVISLVLSLFSYIAPTALELLATGAVFVVSVGLASWLVGYLFSVQAHGESSIITGLILLLIFTPSLSPQMLAIYGFIGLIAGASKYLLVIRGRHIFNPAALAAFVISLTALAYASWWVATPALFIPVLLGAFAILYKTNRIIVGVVFMAVASILFVISQLLYGEPLFDSILLIMSWPIVFFAGYMLTEPLTIPSKKRYAIIAAVVLAILIAIPVKVGDFLIAPATALLLANIYAAIVSRRATLKLVYEGFDQITPTSKELRFKTNKPVRYEAGQYIELTVPHDKADGRGIRRMFSITSAPSSDTFSIAMKFYEPSSTYKKAVTSMKKGAILQSTGVYGSFTLPANESDKLVLFAGGIGITPFISQIRNITANGEKRNITVVYAISNVAEAAYLDELVAAGVNLYVVTDEGDASSGNVTFVKSNRVTLSDLEDIGVSFTASRAYISGPPPFVRSVKAQLKTRSVKSIKTDYFTGY